MTTESSHESAANAETLPPETETEKLVAEYEAAAAKPAPSAIEVASEKEDWAEVSRLRGLSHKDGAASPPKRAREVLADIRAAQAKAAQTKAAPKGAKAGAAR